MTKTNRITLPLLTAIMLLTALFLASCSAGQPRKPTEASSAPETTATSLPPVEPTTEPVTEPVVVVPEGLGELLEQNGISVQTLADLDCRQLVTVCAADTVAQIRFYYLDNGQWHLQDTLTCDGYLGKKGASHSKQEGDLVTPKGLFFISDAFYIGEAPQTGLDLFQITPDTYWVDDPDSVYYNRRVEGTANRDWTSAEHMIQYRTAYEYGFVVDYNAEAVPGAGSAIFFHVGYGETAGCIATDRELVLQYLAALDKNCNPHILIG